jgi:hypothetical protein
MGKNEKEERREVSDEKLKRNRGSPVLPNPMNRADGCDT